jgi:hypothetical protein
MMDLLVMGRYLRRVMSKARRHNQNGGGTIAAVISNQIKTEPLCLTVATDAFEFFL